MTGLRRDYLVTFVSEMFVLLAVVVLFKVAAAYWGVEGFAEYSLVRRVGNLLQLPLAVGVGVAVARYVSIAISQDRLSEGGRYFSASLLVALVPALLFVGVVQLAGKPLTNLLFSDPAYQVNLKALSILVLGLNLHTAVYGYLRGKLAMPQANALQVINKAVIPLAVFLIPGLAVAQVMQYIGLGLLGVSLATAVLIWLGYLQADRAVFDCRRQLGELLRFGVPRIPGEFALAGLLGLPAVFISHAADAQTAGLFAFSMALLVMVGGVFAPLGLVMLPQVSGLAASGKVQAIGPLVNRMLVVAVVLSAGGALAFQVLGDWLIGLYLGPGFESVSSLAKVVLWSAVPYVVYIVLRNALEALKVKPYNTKNLLLALAVLVACQLLVQQAQDQAKVLLAAMTVLGLLTFRDYRAVLGELKGNRLD